MLHLLTHVQDARGRLGGLELFGHVAEAQEDFGCCVTAHLTHGAGGEHGLRVLDPRGGRFPQASDAGLLLVPDGNVLERRVVIADEGGRGRAGLRVPLLAERVACVADERGHELRRHGGLHVLVADERQAPQGGDEGDVQVLGDLHKQVHVACVASHLVGDECVRLGVDVGFGQVSAHFLLTECLVAGNLPHGRSGFLSLNRLGGAGLGCSLLGGGLRVGALVSHVGNLSLHVEGVSGEIVLEFQHLEELADSELIVHEVLGLLFAHTNREGRCVERRIVVHAVRHHATSLFDELG